MEWETSDVIALVAAIGTIIAVIVTGVSIYFNYRGSEKRHKRQLAHERREAMATTAARAYMRASKLKRLVSEVEKTAGIGVLVSLYKRVREDRGRLCFCGVDGQPLSLLRSLKVDEVVPFYADFAEAAGSF